MALFHALWPHSSFREQFGDLARKRGVEESLIPHWTNEVMAWGKYHSRLANPWTLGNPMSKSLCRIWPTKE